MGRPPREFSPRGHAKPGSGFPPDRFNRLLLEHVNFRWFSAAVAGRIARRWVRRPVNQWGNINILRGLAATAIESFT